MSDKNFEREKLVYEQNYEQLRAVNAHMNNIPLMSMTITGALWFAIGIKELAHDEIRFMILILSAYFNLALIFALHRVRDIFQSYLEIIEAFHPSQKKQGKPKEAKLKFMKGYSMVTIYSVMMFSAAVSAMIVAFSFYWKFKISIYLGGGIVSLPLIYLIFLKLTAKLMAWFGFK